MNVIFYTINKLTPYIQELNSTQITGKEELLNKVYSSQKSLWEYEKKYILFEGYCKWIF
jgi:ribosomal protein S24E